jgi:hypothetical protein
MDSLRVPLKTISIEWVGIDSWSTAHPGGASKYKDMPEKLKAPGCKTVPRKSLSRVRIPLL